MRSRERPGIDRGRFDLWALPAFGPTSFLELTVGGVQGTLLDERARYGAGGPLLQGKLLLRETRPHAFPGMALVMGSNLPYGRGAAFVAPPNLYAYLAASYALPRDELLVHANVGLGAVRIEGATVRRFTWGLGTQVHVRRSVNLVAEVFAGDPYGGVSGIAMQDGFRFILSEHVQLDTTTGWGVTGAPRLPFWISTGIRIVSSPLW